MGGASGAGRGGRRDGQGGAGRSAVMAAEIAGTGDGNGMRNEASRRTTAYVPYCSIFALAVLVLMVGSLATAVAMATPRYAFENGTGHLRFPPWYGPSQ